MGTQLSQVQNQNQTAPNNILRLGNVGASPKFEHLIQPLNHSSFGVHSQSMPSSAFFMNENTTNQAFEEHHSQQGPNLFSNKQLHGLMQLPDLQGNNNNNNSDSSLVAAPNSNLFNLSFFPSSNSTGTLIHDQFNTISGSDQGTTTTTTTLYVNNNNNNNTLSDHVASSFSSLFGNSIENVSSPQMSATALLQQAAQMGSTTTTNNASSLLRGICSSNDSKGESDHNHNLHGLMNSIPNGNTSLFGNMQGNNENNLCGFHNVDESNNKLPQNLSVHFGGSDKLTLDFLGVNGGMVRNMSSSGFSQREQQQQRQRVMGAMSSFDHHDLKSTQPNHDFGRSTLL